MMEGNFTDSCCIRIVLHKEVGSGNTFFWSRHKVKRDVKLELVLPLKQNWLVIRFQDCRKASMTANDIETSFDQTNTCITPLLVTMNLRSRWGKEKF